ncbi:uncharacterized protein VTP21DRAFT_9369 [Calcarisporiella thermophila]|uniref:uncharacterized protein n=1 Tax=Calcarisporiella thermophila TaxID=911321 RepID=UPI003742EBD8
MTVPERKPIEDAFQLTLLNLKRQIFQLRALRHLQWNSSPLNEVEISSIEFQELVVLEILKTSHSERFPLDSSYILRFLKQYMAIIEAANGEICDSLYDVFVEVMAGTNQKSMDIPGSCFKTYFLDDNCKEFITLKEEQMAISKGTTGLRSWNAGLALSEYIIQHTEIVRGKHILEIGAGPGLLGLTCTKLGAKYVTLSDGCDMVMNLLEENISNNQAHNHASPLFLDWETSSSSSLTLLSSRVDLIVGADITYDSRYIPYLVRVLTHLLSDTNQALIACTVRNQDTFEGFLGCLQESPLQYEIDEEFAGTGKLFFRDEVHGPLVLLRIRKRNA